MNNNTYGFSDLEPMRKKAQLYSKLIVIGTVSLFVSFWIFPFVWFLTGGWFLVLLFYACFAIAAKIVLKNRKNSKKEYEKAYKEVLVIPALAGVFDTYTYRPEDGISTEEVLNIGLWDRNDYKTFHTESEDLLTGTYKGVYYEQSDLTVKATLKGNNQRSVSFSGCVSKFRFNKAVSEKVIVCTCGYSCPSSHLSKVKTENEAFNNKFNIYAGNDHDAFYILTPHFMEAVLKLYEALPQMSGTGNYIRRLWMMFENNTLTIIKDRVRVFEVPIGKQIDFGEEKEKIIRDMRQLIDIVDILNMEQ